MKWFYLSSDIESLPAIILIYDEESLGQNILFHTKGWRRGKVSFEISFICTKEIPQMTKGLQGTSVCIINEWSLIYAASKSNLLTNFFCGTYQSKEGADLIGTDNLIHIQVSNVTSGILY